MSIVILMEKIKMKSTTFIKRYKLEIIWILTTTFIIISMSIVQMYSRSITINKVTKNQFKIVYKLLNEHSAISKNELTNIIAPLIRPNGYALLHTAIITDKTDTCIEVTKHYYNLPLLCPVLKNSHHLSKLLKNEGNYTSEFEIRPKKLLQDENKSQAYIFQKFDNSNEWLIAKTNFLSKSSELEKFIYFLKHRYIDANGYNKIYQKGKFLAVIIVIFSFLFYVLFRVYRRNMNQQYNLINKNLLNLQKEWENLNNKYHALIKEKNLNENMILEKELLLQDNLEISKQERDSLEADIEKLKEINNNIVIKLSEKNKELKEAEQKEIELNKEKQKKIESLSCVAAKSEYEETFQELVRLQQLWHHDPSWNDRKKIESKVSEKDTRLPFTITQGFVAFDDKISKLAKSFDAYEARQKNDLHNFISIVCRENEFKKRRGIFDNIRKARNAWFHRAEYPTSDVITDLIDFLEDYKIKPLI